MRTLPARKSTSMAISASARSAVMAGPLTSDLIREQGISLVVVGIPSLSRQRLKEITAEAFAAEANVAFVPQLSFSSETSTDYVDIDGVLIASLGQPTRKRGYEVAKRMFDFVAALALLVFTLPLWALFASSYPLGFEGPSVLPPVARRTGGQTV